MNVRQNGTVFWHDVIGFVDANWILVPTGLNFALLRFANHLRAGGCERCSEKNKV